MEVLLFSLEQGPYLEKVLEMARKTRQQLPDSVLNAPELLPGLDLYLDAWRELTSCRTFAGRIPWTAVEQWCDRRGIYGQQREDVHFHVGTLDVVYLDFQESQRSAQ